MKIYRISFRGTGQNDEHQGYKFFGSRADANTAIRKSGLDDCKLDVFEYPISKQGMLDALNELGEHPDNG